MEIIRRINKSQLFFSASFEHGEILSALKDHRNWSHNCSSQNEHLLKITEWSTMKQSHSNKSPDSIRLSVFQGLCENNFIFMIFSWFQIVVSSDGEQIHPSSNGCLSQIILIRMKAENDNSKYDIPIDYSFRRSNRKWLSQTFSIDHRIIWWLSHIQRSITMIHTLSNISFSDNDCSLKWNKSSKAKSIRAGELFEVVR